MTGFPLIIAFVVAVVLMIIAISKFKIHPFISIMGISLILGLVAGIPIVDTTLEDGTTVSGIASVIGAGFSGTFSSIGIVIILGALIGSVLEVTGAALKLADMVINLVGKHGGKESSCPCVGTDGMGRFHSRLLRLRLRYPEPDPQGSGQPYRRVLRRHVRRSGHRSVPCTRIYPADARPHRRSQYTGRGQ